MAFQSMKYQAFISYKHSDFSRHKVMAVENAFKKYAKPFWKPSIKFFRDKKEMPTGSNMEYLKTATFRKLTAEEKKELGIEGFKLDQEKTEVRRLGS